MNRNLLIGNRIVAARKLRNFKAKDLARELDVTTSRLSNWENGTSGMSADYIFKVSEILNVTSDYLIGLSDNPGDITDNLITKQIVHTIANMNNLNLDGQSRVEQYSYDILQTGNYSAETPEPLNLSEYTELYTDAQAAAGAGAYNYGYDDGSYIRIRKSDVPDYDAIIDIRGDSMYPTIETGDVAFIDFNFDCKDGKIYIVQHEDETYIKRCYFENNKLIMKSDNPEYEDIVFKNSELDQVRVIGKVTGWATPEK